MLRFLFIPLVGLGGLLLVGGRFGGPALPADLAGVPTPMVLFIAAGGVVLLALRSLSPE